MTFHTLMQSTALMVLALGLSPSRAAPPSPLSRVSDVQELGSGHYSASDQVFLEGYYPASSGGSGWLFKDSSGAPVNPCTAFTDASGTVYRREFNRPLSVLDCGATGSPQSAIGSISAGASLLSLVDTKDFVAGHNVAIVGAGAAYQYTWAPTRLGVKSEGAAHGAATWCYRIAAIDSGMGVGPATVEECTKGADELGWPIKLHAPARFNRLSWTAAPGASAAAYVIYGRTPGAETCIGITTRTEFSDYGHSQNCPGWVPAQPLRNAQNDVLRTRIVRLEEGGKALLADAAENTPAAGARIFHDDTAALNSALTHAASSPQSILLPCGQYNIFDTLTLSVTGLWMVGEGTDCSSIMAHGTFDVVTFSHSSQGGLEKLTIDASDMAAGNAESVVQYHRARNNFVTVTSPYNFMNVTHSSALDIEHVLVKTEVRGDWGIQLEAPDSSPSTGKGPVQTPMFRDITIAPSWTATCLLLNGNVTSVFVQVPFSCLSAPRELVIDNTAGGTGLQSFFSFYGLALNNCWGRCADIQSGKDMHFEKIYSQAELGNQASNIYLGPRSGDIKFIGGDIFGADLHGIEDHAFAVQISAVQVYANSFAQPDSSDGIFCANDAQGLVVDGGNDFAVGAEAAKTTQRYGVYLSPGCRNASVSGVWIGKSGGVMDATGIPGNVSIQGLNAGSTTASVKASSGTLLPAAMLAAGTAGAVTVIYRSGASADFSDTTDSAANIIASLKHAVPGTTFRIRLYNLTTRTQTLAGGPGVSLSGAIPAGGCRDLVGTVTGVDSVAID